MHAPRIALALVLLISGSLFAEAPAHYLPADSVDLASILPGPPAPGSPANDTDLQTVLIRQHARTPAEVDRLQSEVKLSPAAFADILGSWFAQDKVPLTFALLENADDDAHSVAGSAKHLWHRTRPPLQDPAIHPATALPATDSYPSFHAISGALWAAILAELVPDLKQRIVFRGDQIGNDRVIGGVHFPTDVAAGQKLGRVLAKRFLDNPTFRHDFQAAREEITRVRQENAGKSPVSE